MLSRVQVSAAQNVGVEALDNIYHTTQLTRASTPIRVLAESRVVAASGQKAQADGRWELALV